MLVLKQFSQTSESVDVWYPALKLDLENGTERYKQSVTLSRSNCFDEKRLRFGALWSSVTYYTDISLLNQMKLTMPHTHNCVITKE